MNSSALENSLKCHFAKSTQECPPYTDCLHSVNTSSRLVAKVLSSTLRN